METLNKNSRKAVRQLSFWHLLVLISILLGLAALLGWTIDNPSMKTLSSGKVSMNPLTAVALIGAGFSLLFSNQSLSGFRRLSQFLAIGIAGIGLIKVIDILGIPIGIDQILFHSSLNESGQVSTNRMAANTAFGFLLFGTALCFLTSPSSQRIRRAQILALASGTLSLVALIGYSLDAAILYQFGSSIPMALNTALSLFSLSLALFLAYPNQGLMIVIRAEKAGSLMGRRLLPIIIILPIALGWLRLEGQNLGLYNTEFGVSLMTIMTILFLVSLVIWSAWSLNKVDDQARQNERFLDLIVENIPIVMHVKDANNLRYIKWNKAGENVLALPRSELLGKTDHDFFPATLANSFLESDRMALNNRQLIEVPEETIPTPLGDRVFNTKKLPILDDAGKVQFLLVLMEDITAFKEAMATVRAMNEKLSINLRELEAVNKELESFSYSVSHDLRAPLRSVAGFSNILIEDYSQSLDSIGLDYLQRIKQAAQRMGMLIDGLLDLSRFSRRDLQKEKINLSRISESILQELQSADPQRLAQVTIEKDIFVHADAQLLNVVLTNLIGNAWKFTLHQKEPKIEIATTEISGERVCYIRDNGAGFDMAYSSKLFGAFQRLHSTTEFEGTGIGLATVQRILHRHGSRIWAEASPGQGATFYFSVGST